MYSDIEENIRKNLIIYLSSHQCTECFKPYSDSTYIEIDDLAFYFADKIFYKLDCSVSRNINAIKKNVNYFIPKSSRQVYSLIKPRLHGNSYRICITCKFCYKTIYKEYNMSKFDGTKIYLNNQ